VSANDRGLRNPRHTFATAIGNRALMPFMIAPLRPGETLVGLRLQTHAFFNQMVKYYHSAPCEVEFAIWKVSVRQIGEFFVDMFANDIEDQRTTAQLDPSTGVRIAPTPINVQGDHSRTPLQVRDRGWAGEFGQPDTDVTIVPQSAYAPYVSHGIWHIARMCYDLQTLTTNELLDGNPPYPSNSIVGSVDAHQTPPRLGRLVKSATSSAMGWQTGSDAVPTSTSLSDWAERLSVLDNPNRTYFEYLRAFGIDPKRIEGMPEPVLMQRRHLRPHGGSVAPFIPVNTTVTKLDSFMGIRAKSIPNVLNGGTVTGMLGDFGGLYNVGAVLDETRGKRLFVEEPSFLIGTVAWWPYDFDHRAVANVFDAVYMINSGTWGDPTGGAVDERDFLINRLIEQPLTGANGTPLGSLVSTQNEMGQTGPFAINMLNLFLNGDTYCTSPTDLGHIKGGMDGTQGTEDAYGVSPAASLGDILRLNCYGDVRFGVATDLVPK